MLKVKSFYYGLNKSIRENHGHPLLCLVGLVSKVEKKLADQTDFFNYKNEMIGWITKAEEILDSCNGKGSVDDIKQQMETVNVI